METELAIGMTSAPRRESYYALSLTSLRSAGFEAPVHVFAEPDTVIEHPSRWNAVVHRNRSTKGAFQNWRSGLRWLIQNQCARWYLMLEDDVIWRDDGHQVLLSAMRNRAFRHAAILSPYTSEANLRFHAQSEIAEEQWLPANYRRHFWGALTIAMSSDVALEVIEHERFQESVTSEPLDIVLGKICEDMNRAILVHVPSICDHIGKYSTLGHDTHKEWRRRGFLFRPKVACNETSIP